MLNRTHIVIHHSLTKDGDTVSWGAIQDYHTITLGWNDIGYHAGVELINGRYYALVGRDINVRAAAVKEQDMNGKALHVCCVGNYDLIPPPQAMLAVLIERILKPWMDSFEIPVFNIMAHHDFAPYKSCPGTQFNMIALRGLI